jgi:squalene cyclase
MALMRAGCEDRGAVERGVAFLRSRQQADGSWDREAMAGVFNHTCMLNYDLYYQTFPIWALGLYERYRRDGAA